MIAMHFAGSNKWLAAERLHFAGSNDSFQRRSSINNAISTVQYEIAINGAQGAPSITLGSKGTTGTSAIKSYVAKDDHMGDYSDEGIQQNQLNISTVTQAMWRLRISRAVDCLSRNHRTIR